MAQFLLPCVWDFKHLGGILTYRKAWEWYLSHKLIHSLPSINKICHYILNEVQQTATFPWIQTSPACQLQICLGLVHETTCWSAERPHGKSCEAFGSVVPATSWSSKVSGTSSSCWSKCLKYVVFSAVEKFLWRRGLCELVLYKNAVLHESGKFRMSFPDSRWSSIKSSYWLLYFFRFWGSSLCSKEVLLEGDSSNNSCLALELGSCVENGTNYTRITYSLQKLSAFNTLFPHIIWW